MNPTNSATMRRIFSGLTLMLGAVMMAPAADASPLYAGTTYGSWSDPVESGQLIAVDGSSVFTDNTGTAVHSIVNSTDLNTGSELLWGASSTSNPGNSSAIFFGNTFSGVAPDQQFKLGTITYRNGTSDLNSLIFGATLTIGVLNEPSIFAKVTDLSIVTTSNTGISPQRDADFLGFSAFPNTFNVYEGFGATAELYGKIVGDPQLELSGITLAPGQTNAFIGSGVPSVPVPAALPLLGSAIAALGLFGRKARRRA